jgi:hypothetical protein
MIFSGISYYDLIAICAAVLYGYFITMKKKKRR